MQIVIASHNPLKTQASLSGFQKMFPGKNFETFNVDAESEVSNQPQSAAETCTGAYNRAKNAQKVTPKGDYWVGIEGGLDVVDPAEPKKLFAFAWIVILSKECPAIIGKSRTMTYPLPPAVCDLILGGLEMGEAVDQVFGEANYKQIGGGIGLLTKQVLMRHELFEQSVIAALIPFKSSDLFLAK